jgi:hypothetical protein
MARMRYGPSHCVRMPLAQHVALALNWFCVCRRRQ